MGGYRPGRQPLAKAASTATRTTKTSTPAPKYEQLTLPLVSVARSASR